MLACSVEPERDAIVCRGCGFVLAERVGQVFVIRHGGRTWIVSALLGTECPRCGEGWDADCEGT